MSSKVLRQTSDRVPPQGPAQRAFVADMAPGPLEQAALERLSGASLTFNGRRVAHHALRLPWGEVLSVTLWQRQKSGYVVAFQAMVGGKLRPHAAGTETLEDAICFLEDYCSRLPEPVTEPVSLEQTLLDLHRGLVWRTNFLALVGEVLADWIDLPQRGTKKHQNKATA